MLLSFKREGDSDTRELRTHGKTHVLVDRRDEVPFSGSPPGSQDANWIDAGSSYEFRLYNADHTKLLDKIVVTKASD
jgi:hypothetical protein